MTRGGRICFFSSLRSRRVAACVSRRLCYPGCRARGRPGPQPARASASSAIVTTTSSRRHLSPARGNLRRIWWANAWPNLRPSVDHSTGCASGTFDQLRPLPDHLVADHNAASGQRLVHVAQAEGEAEAEPDGVADDLGRKPMAGVAGANWRRHPIRLPGPVCLDKPVRRGTMYHPPPRGRRVSPASAVKCGDGSNQPRPVRPDPQAC